jgi:beta-galactosidase
MKARKTISTKLGIFSLLVTIGLMQQPLAMAEQGYPQTQRIDDNWKFQLGDPSDGAAPDFNDSSWRTVNLPHDWSIESKTDPTAPMGGGGGFFPSGIGWYRQKLEAPTNWKGKHVEVEFEGVYENATIYLNGKKLNFQPYGYTTFFVDLTPELQLGSANELAVRVDNSQQKNSRWYSGSGIYRHVWLHVTNPIRVSNWGVVVRTESASDASASLDITTQLTNPTDQPVDIEVSSSESGPGGEALGSVKEALHLKAREEKETTSHLVVKSPPLWFPETPKMCKTTTEVRLAGSLSSLDHVVTPFGIRKLAWNVTDGFTINGRTYKIKGGCVHGDNGVLGVCAFDRAEERKVEVLKAAGFNAIRTAHNPYSPAFLDACDRLGMMVMENSFDCWTKGKNRKDYSIYFKDWWQRDLNAMILRDRNHPSIVLWDIGNEVPAIFEDSTVAAYASKMVQEVHSLDGTRPVTIASRLWPKEQDLSTAEISWSAQDIVGSNYAIGSHIKRHEQFPNRVLLSTESFAPFGEWQAVLKNTYLIGDFIWTAQDYLGEVGVGRWFLIGDATEPVDKADPKKPGEIRYFGQGSDKLYPWHGAPCGLVDILGFAKPIAKNRNVLWQTGQVKLGMAVLQPESDTVKVKLFPWGGFPSWDSWTWPGWEGKPMQVEVYSTYLKTRLYLNDKLVAEQDMSNGKTTYKVNYEPGVLKAVALNNENKEVESTQFATSGDAAGICLKPDCSSIAADGQDLSFVRVEVVDKAGRLQPNADAQIHFNLTGPGTIAGLGNANLKDETPYQGMDCRVYRGVALVVLRSSHQAGSLYLRAEAQGLASAKVHIATNP